MGVRIRVGRFCLWGVLLVLGVLAGGLGYAYFHYTDSKTLAALVRAEAPVYLPGSRVDVGQVRLRAWRGEVSLTNLTVTQTIDGAPFQAVRVPWMDVRFDARAMLKGKHVPRDVVVAQPTLRLVRRQDGTWNLQGLLADPWPAPTMEGSPPVAIQNGTVELADFGPDGKLVAVAILRDVRIKVEPADGAALKFEGSAKGDLFDRLGLHGTIDRATGRVTLQGEAAGVALSETLRKRLPADLRALVEKVGLTGGELDVEAEEVVYDPGAVPRLRYDVSGRLVSGTWACEKLPFTINDLSMAARARDGALTIDRAEGFHGSTVVRAHGKVALDDPKRSQFDIHVDLFDLELDDRLRKWTPPQFAVVWNGFQPRGRVSAGIDVGRASAGGPVSASARVDFLDLAILYTHFKYPLDHIRGRLDWTPARVAVDLRSLVGGKPFTVKGTIDKPGPDTVVNLDFNAGAVPLDKALLDAMPPDVRAVIDDFKPAGSVRGTLHLTRTPPAGPKGDPRGKVSIDAKLELNERCSIAWKGLPYPVENLTGKLEIHPDQWIFTEMRGGHGQASLTGSGKVEKVGRDARGRDRLKVDLNLKAAKLPFDEELKLSLPPAWRKSWDTLSPTGTSDVEARIRVRPGLPDDYHLVLTPGPATGVRLQYSRDPKPGVDPGGTFKLPMDDVNGRFVFDNGTVRMYDVGFVFHGAPVQFAGGTVVVEDSGRFTLGVRDLAASGLRLDSRLQAIMPPVMAQFARRLDDGKPFTVKGDLGLRWSGRAGQPVLCEWNKVKVILIDNSIQTGIPLEHLQGQLEYVRGKADGDLLEVHGALRLDSVILLGQQITQLESPFHVEKGKARLDDVRGGLLGGEVTGKFEVSLDATPSYAASVALRDADLQRYAKTIPGRQTFRGLVAGRLDVQGRGNDMHSLQGAGEAHVTQGDLGELPGFLRLIKVLTLSPATKTAFDSADVAVKIRDGESTIDPIKFTGDAFSLMGKGKLDVRGELDMRLRVLYGRDKLHLLLISDALREASGQFLVVRVLGTASSPKFKLEPLPKFIDVGKTIQRRAASRAERGGR